MKPAVFHSGCVRIYVSSDGAAAIGFVDGHGLPMAAESLECAIDDALYGLKRLAQRFADYGEGGFEGKAWYGGVRAVFSSSCASLCVGEYAVELDQAEAATVGKMFGKALHYVIRSQAKKLA